MALHTKKQFAELCGLTTGNLSVYEGRRKVVYSGGYVDDSIEPNISFITKRKKILKKEKPVKEIEQAPPAEHIKVAAPTIRPPKAPKVHPKHTSISQLTELDAEKVRLQNEKLSLANEFLRKKLEKIEGEAIPTDMVKGIISQLGRTYPTEYYAFWEQTVTELGRKFRIPAADIAHYRGYGIEGINKFSMRAIDQAKRELKQVISIYSDKRDVGERDQ